jgi:hypothetical protein
MSFLRLTSQCFESLHDIFLVDRSDGNGRYRNLSIFLQELKQSLQRSKSRGLDTNTI